MATKIVESAQANVFGQKIPKNKNAMCTITTDPIAPWFIAAEELGEFIGIRFGRVPPEGTEPEWMFLRHTDFDGIGGLAELLRRRGAHLPRLPQIKHPSPPSWLSLRRVPPKPPQAAAAGKMGRAGWAGHDQHQHAVAARGGLAHLRGN